MRQHNTALQKFQFIYIDTGIGQQAKTGIDAIYGAVFFYDVEHSLLSSLNSGFGTVIERQADMLPIYSA